MFKLASQKYKTKKMQTKIKYLNVDFNPLPTLKYLRKGNSFVRFGDGELMCMQKENIGQKIYFNMIITENLVQELTSAYLNLKYQIGTLNLRFLYCNERNQKKFQLKALPFTQDNNLLQILNTRTSVYSSSFWDHVMQNSRYKNIFELLNIKDNLKVLYISHIDNIQKMKNLSQNRENNFYIETPKEAVYEQIQLLMDKIEKEINNYNINILLISVGMSSKIIINKLINKYPSIQFIDYGNPYDRLAEKKNKSFKFL